MTLLLSEEGVPKKWGASSDSGREEVRLSGSFCASPGEEEPAVTLPCRSEKGKNPRG